MCLHPRVAKQIILFLAPTGAQGVTLSVCLSVRHKFQVSLRSLCAYIVRQTEPKILRLFSFFGGLLFNLGACWDRGPNMDLDQGLTISWSGFLRMEYSVVQNSLLLPVLNFENHRL